MREITVSLHELFAVCYSATMNRGVDEQAVKGLLGRGGGALALAAVAHSRGRTAESGTWYVLSPQLAAAAEQVLEVLEGGVDPAFLASAVRRAMDGEPVTAVPGWALPIVNTEDVLPRLGEIIDAAIVAPAFPPGAHVTDARQKGLAALAVAFCRSRDTLKTMCSMLPGNDGNTAMTMSRLAQATVCAGDPSRARRVLKRHLKEMGIG